MKGSLFIQDLEAQFEEKCKGNNFCTFSDFNVQDLNSDCGDVILERAFSSEFDDVALDFDHTSSSIGKFDVT